MKKLIAFLVVCLCLPLCFLWHAPLYAMEHQYVPRGRKFRHTFADPREIRMALALQGDLRLNASIGNYFSILSLKEEEPEGWETHFGLEGAGYFMMMQADRRYPLETADGLIGVYSEAAKGQFQWQFRFTHISAHLADGSTGQAFPYSRETLHLRSGWVPNELLQLYAGIGFHTHAMPEVPSLNYQVGFSFFWKDPFDRLLPFVASDIKWRRESEFDPSWSFQVGLALNDPPEVYRSFRFFYSYYTGADPRGQFYRIPLTVHALGLEMQI